MTRKRIAYTLGALSLLLSTGAYAQPANQANVPFAFIAGNVELPAGDYLIQQKSESNFISIADAKSGKVVFAFSAERQALPMDATPKMVFRRYGNQHFLAALWTGGGGTARVFSTSAEEMQSRAHLVAGNPTNHNVQTASAMK